MIQNLVTAIAPLAFSMALSGVVFGLLYFAALRRTSILLAAGGRCINLLVLTFSRILGIVVFLSLTAKLGAAALLAAFGGFLAARATAVRVIQRAD
jgi:hypothetical protein